MRESKKFWWLMAMAVGLVSWGCVSTDYSSEDDYEYNFEEPDPLPPISNRPLHLPRHQPGTTPDTVPMGSEDLEVYDDGARAVASDTETNAVYMVEIKTGEMLGQVDLGRSARPGRLTIQQDLAHVILRGTGELVTIDLNEYNILRRTKVCPAPRGVSYDQARNRVWVSCASGELLALDPATLALQSKSLLDADLRDVVATKDGVFVARFRAAEILSIDPATGEERLRLKLPAEPGTSANTIWRLRPLQDGRVLTSYQVSATENLSLPDESIVRYYGEAVTSGCGSVVSTMTSVVKAREDGSLEFQNPTCHNDITLPTDITTRGPLNGAGLASASIPRRPLLTNVDKPPVVPASTQALAAVVTPTGTFIGLTRDNGRLQLRVKNQDKDTTTQLTTTTVPDLGHALFHSDTGNGIACASCHPEGGDDGHVWQFERTRNFGEVYKTFSRRTQNLSGGIEGKLHWDGEFEDINELMGKVFTERMGGFTMEDGDSEALQNWLNTLQPQTGQTLAPGERLSAERGKELYEDAQVGCTNCHGGEKHTDYKLYDVGTGGTFKTPTLRGISQRHQLMHDGCAKTLRGRFDPRCGGDAHGDLTGLTSDDLNDLTTYLKTL